MNKILWYPLYIIAYLGVLIAWGCQTNNTGNTSEKEQSLTFSSETEEIEVKYAKNFKVKYFEDYKLVTITKVFQDSNETLEYVLLHAGKKPPKNFKKEQIIQIPVQSLITLSSTHVALADVLDVTKTIIGNSNNNIITSGKLPDRIKAEKVAEVGRGNQLNRELIIALQPDILMMSGVYASVYNKYQEALSGSTNILVNTEWMEEHPLARAEWIKFLALFYNKEKLANQKFKKIESDYLRIKKLAQNVHRKPTVFGGLPHKNTWYVARGNSYVAKFLKDAGADYIWKDIEGVGSYPLDFERVFEKAYQCDYWLNVGVAKSKEQMLNQDSRYAQFDAFQNDAVYNNNAQVNKQGGNDYWMTGLVNPHIVLADLVKIFHPQLLPEHKLFYYKKIDNHEDTDSEISR